MRKIATIFLLLVFISCSQSSNISETDTSENLSLEELAWCNANVRESYENNRRIYYYPIFEDDIQSNFQTKDYILFELIILKNIKEYPWLNEKDLDAFYALDENNDYYSKFLRYNRNYVISMCLWNSGI